MYSCEYATTMTANHDSAAQPITPSYVPTIPASFAPPLTTVVSRRMKIVHTPAACRPMQAAIAPVRRRTSASSTPSSDEREERIDERQRLRVALEQSAQHVKAVLPRHLFGRHAQLAAEEVQRCVQAGSAR